MRHAVLFISLTVALAEGVSAAAPTNEEQLVRAMVTAARDDRLEAFLKTVDTARIASSSHGECTPGALVAVGKLLAKGNLWLETRRAGATVVRATNGEEITAFFTIGDLSQTPERPKGGCVIVGVRIHIPSDP